MMMDADITTTSVAANTIADKHRYGSGMGCLPSRPPRRTSLLVPKKGKGFRSLFSIKTYGNA